MRRSRPNVIAFLQGVASRLKGIRLNATASSLAFTTLLALVPLATVAFAVVSQFPAFEKGLATLEDWLVRGLMPGTGAGVVRDSIRQFAEQAARLAPLTVVFAHGFCLRMGAFHFQRARLTEQWGSQVRMVFYDQRGHG